MIGKKISSFLKSEKASVSRKQLLSAAVSAGLVFVLAQDVSACYSLTTHTNAVAFSSGAVGVDKTSTHSNHSNHTSHCSY